MTRTTKTGALHGAAIGTRITTTATGADGTPRTFTALRVGRVGDRGLWQIDGAACPSTLRGLLALSPDWSVVERPA